MTTTAGEFDDLVWRNPAPHAAPPSAPSPSKTVNVTMPGAMCAFMGPQGNDPMCPCKMRQAGLEPTPVWTPEKREELKRALKANYCSAAKNEIAPPSNPAPKPHHDAE